MSIFTRSLFTAALAATTLLTACSDKNTDAPAPADPTPIYRLTHFFHDPTTNTGSGTIYPSKDIKAEARLFPVVLALDFSAGPDAPHLEIYRSQLKPGWVGTYALRCRTRATDPVFVSYSYQNNGGSRIYRFSDLTQTLTGDVTITAYDEKRQLLSGHFEVTAPDQRDPVSDAPEQKTTILLTGDFSDMKVQVQ
ncbi:hypothetical protein [Hymenobacter chitinivorans]|uniref:Lipoprotein n=1 Tax=Hymenobacter chitinivorans DSM 11115 TaxID=1121954 RepID=A0A2M9BPQ1_9BACT|nr:hypothetical protein [Hymenobacter chitinivorans]PJJ59941.1 hypothetical protein CLV45_1363 [Hymenobacter chitinivorans DSM 11115]